MTDTQHENSIATNHSPDGSPEAIDARKRAWPED
jgi:hypothetical protein